MHTIPQSIEVMFDLNKLPELENRVYRILWVSISIGHIRDQYFTEHVASVTKTIKDRKPQEFKHFLSIIRGSGLRVFGKEDRDRYVKGYRGIGRPHRSKNCRGINKKWWRQVWNLIKYNGDIKLIKL